MRDIEEIWKDIKGYEGIYQVSNQGRIKSLSRIDESGAFRKEFIRKPSTSKYGYKFVQLRKNKRCKIIFVHRLVADAFIPNPLHKPYINHKDENRTNNNVENLEWCDMAYNNNYGTRIEKVRRKLGIPIYSINISDGKKEYFLSINEAAKITKSSRRHIQSVLKGMRKTHNKRIWKYYEGEDV